MFLDFVGGYGTCQWLLQALTAARTLTYLWISSGATDRQTPQLSDPDLTDEIPMRHPRDEGVYFPIHEWLSFMVNGFHVGEYILHGWQGIDLWVEFFRLYLHLNRFL